MGCAAPWGESAADRGGSADCGGQSARALVEVDRNEKNEIPGETVER